MRLFQRENDSGPVPPVCRQCSAPLDRGVESALCPRCLMALAVGNDLEPIREYHNGHAYQCWRGEHVEFQIIDSGYSPDLMTGLVGELDAIHDYACDLTGLLAPEAAAGTVVLRERPDLPQGAFVPVDEHGVIGVSSQTVKTGLAQFRDQATLSANLICLSFDRFYDRLLPVLAYPEFDKANRRASMAGVLKWLAMACSDENRAAFERLIRHGKQAVSDFSEMPEFGWLDLIETGKIKSGGRKVRLVPLTFGILFELFERCGEEEFVRRLFGEAIPDLPEVRTNRDAVDNLFRALGRAAETDLSEFLIGQMRWPVSETAKQKADR